MLRYPLVDQLKSLRLHSMASCLEEQMNMKDIVNYSFDDRLGMMVDREVMSRSNRHLTRRLNKAKFKVSKSLFLCNE